MGMFDSFCVMQFICINFVARSNKECEPTIRIIKRMKF